jgi:hypothetical protein
LAIGMMLSATAQTQEAARSSVHGVVYDSVARNAIAGASISASAPMTIVTAVCGASGIADSTGWIIGVILNARQNTPLEGAIAEAAWNEITIDARGISQIVQKATARANASGWVTLCHVPANVEVALLAARDADSTGLVPATVPVAGLTRRDLQIGGVARIRGTVADERVRPITNARVTIVGRNHVAVTDTTVAFSLAEIPSGSRIEAYRAGQVPAEFGGLSGCGAIVVWTKMRLRR